MSYICGACHNQHESVVQAKICFGIIRPPEPIRPAEVMISGKQLNYIGDLGGDKQYARTLTRKQASEYISQLQRGIGVNLPTSTPQVQQPSKDPKQQMLESLIDGLPDGRYATRADESEAFTFFRIKRHTRGRLNGCLTVQTQHSERLMQAGVRWNSGFWTWTKPSVIESVLMACIDPKQAAYNYAKALNRCGVCGKDLTDERSRWYGIGPDCETRHEEFIEWVDEQHDGKPYEIARRSIAF